MYKLIPIKDVLFAKCTNIISSGKIRFSAIKHRSFGVKNWMDL